MVHTLGLDTMENCYHPVPEKVKDGTCYQKAEFLFEVLTGATVFCRRTEPNHNNLAERYYFTSVFTSDFQMVSLIGQTTHRPVTRETVPVAQPPRALDKVESRSINAHEKY